MNFICSPCRAGADAKFGFTLEEVKANFHRKCRGGTWCDCQHRVKAEKK